MVIVQWDCRYRALCRPGGRCQRCRTVDNFYHYLYVWEPSIRSDIRFFFYLGKGIVSPSTPFWYPSTPFESLCTLFWSPYTLASTYYHILIPSRNVIDQRRHSTANVTISTPTLHLLIIYRGGFMSIQVRGWACWHERGIYRLSYVPRRKKKGVRGFPGHHCRFSVRCPIPTPKWERSQKSIEYLDSFIFPNRILTSQKLRDFALG